MSPPMSTSSVWLPHTYNPWIRKGCTWGERDQGSKLLGWAATEEFEGVHLAHRLSAS